MTTFMDLPIGGNRKLIAAASNYTSSTNLTPMTLVKMEEDPRVTVENGEITFSATTKVLVQFAVQYPVTSGTVQAITIASQLSDNGSYVGDIRHTFDRSTSQYAQMYETNVGGQPAAYTFNKGYKLYSFNSYYGSSSDKKATCYMFIYIWE